VPENEQSVECVNFFEEFLAQLYHKATEIERSEITVSLRLSESARNIRQLYSHNTLQLYKHLRQCLRFEVNLERNPKVFSRKTSTQDDVIGNALEILTLHIREIENENRILKQDYEVFCLRYHELNKFTVQSEHVLAQRPDLSERITAARNEYSQKLQLLQNDLTCKNVFLADKFERVVSEADAIQKNVLDTHLNEWLLNQKMIAMDGE
jgi:signal transducer and activator of transcription 5B